MKIFVKAKPNSKEEKLQKISDSHYIILIKEPPVQGRANAAIIRVVADYFKVNHSQVNIVSGRFSKSKIIEIS